MHRIGWRRMGVFWMAVCALLVTWVGYFLTSAGMVALEAQQHGQPFQWSEVWLRWLDGSSENLFSEFAITAFLLWFVDRTYSKKRRYRAGDEE